MNKIFSLGALVLVLSGCRSYSELCDQGSVASYEVVNNSYRLLGVVPLMTGETWKTGPYTDGLGGLKFFEGECSLDDNLASVRHACEVVGSDKVRGLASRADTYSAWSFFLIQKRVLKTSCEIVKE